MQRSLQVGKKHRSLCLFVLNEEVLLVDVVRAMGVMGLTRDQQMSVFRVLSAILTLGNVSFSQNDKDEARVDNQDELGWVAHLLQVDETECQNALVLRTIESGSQRASVFKCPQNVEGEKDTE